MKITGIREKERYIICFCDPDKRYPFYDWFKTGFRHVQVYIDKGEFWVHFDPMRHRLGVKLLDKALYPKPWTTDKNHTIVEKVLFTWHTERRATFGVWTCTSQVKALLGIDSKYILTPYQLFRALT